MGKNPVHVPIPVGAGKDHLTQISAESIQDSGLEEKFLHGRWLVHKHFLQKIAGNPNIRTGKGLQECFNIISLAHRHAQKLQAGDPTFRLQFKQIQAPLT